MAEWPPVGSVAAHSAYDMFSWYKYLVINLVFSHLGFWSGNLLLIAPFPDLCLLVLFCIDLIKPGGKEKLIQKCLITLYRNPYCHSISFRHISFI